MSASSSDGYALEHHKGLHLGRHTRVDVTDIDSCKPTSLLHCGICILFNKPTPSFRKADCYSKFLRFRSPSITESAINRTAFGSTYLNKKLARFFL